MHYKLEHQESFENSQIKKVAELIVEGVLVWLPNVAKTSQNII